MRGFGLLAWLVIVAAGCAGAAAAAHERSTATSELPANIEVDDDAGIHFHQEPMEDFTIGGIPEAGVPEQLITTRRVDAGSTAVSSDGGAISGELAWLVTHIADTPDRLRSDDSDNARQIASRGAPGVRAVVGVFARGDALRLPFARRVVERNIMRVCHIHDRSDAAALAAWIELGEDASDPPPGGVMHWNRPADAPWPPDAVHRLIAWLDADIPCAPIVDASPSPVPASSGSPAPTPNARDAGAHDGTP